MSKESFISSIAKYAQKAGNANKVLPSIIIAQAALESAWGTSGLVEKGDNLFGVKGDYRGKSVSMTTSEHSEKKGWYKIVAKFRKYPTYYESIMDLVALYKLPRYHAVIGERNAVNAARAIQSAGYATDPGYANKLIATIEANNLTQYDALPKTNKIVKTVKTAVKKVIKKTPVHEVVKGDTLWGIAHNNHTSVDALKKINKLKSDTIHPGQKLKLK